MSESTIAPQGTKGTSTGPGHIAERFRQLYDWVDDRVGNVARAAAYALPWRILSVVLAVIGSLLIWFGPKPAAMLALLFHGLDCIHPALGKWLDLSCNRAPIVSGVPWHWLVISISAWMGFFVSLLVIVWFLARLFVSLSSRILSSDLVRIREQSDLAHKVLIMGLSAPPDAGKGIEEAVKLAIEEAKTWSGDAGLYAGPADKWREKAGGAARAVAGGWQQAARMVHAHCAGDKLKTIYILPSYETKGLMPQFKSYLETLFRRTFDIRSVTDQNGKAFEDKTEVGARSQSYDNYKYLREGLVRAVAMAKEGFKEEERRRLWDNEICVDATAGFKLFSIAAAVVTFDRNIVLGYVVTGGGPNPDEGIVKLYDPRIEFLSAVTNRVASTRPQPV